MQIEILEVAGIVPAMQALRLPYSLAPRSFRDFSTTPYWETGVRDQDETDTEHILRNNYRLHVNKEDVALARKLIKAGSEHSKAVRGIMAYLKISAPLLFWNEMNTYRIGCEGLSSTSTMHTITRGVTPEMFDCESDEERYDHFYRLQYLIDEYNEMRGKAPKEEVERQFLKIKGYIPSCFIQTRILAFSYQTLRRIWLQRRNHRLPMWHAFCDALKQLPFADELIFVE